MESYSLGYCFVPTDEELIVEYLLKKIDNQPLPADVIKVVNFSDHGPDTLTREYPPVGHKEWYFFTPRIRKYAKGSRPNRTAGNRFWKASSADKDIKFNNKIIGHKMTLGFHEGISLKDGIKTDWITHEYTAIHPSWNKRDVDDNMKVKNVSKSSSANKRQANLLENQQEEEKEEEVAVRENRGEEEVVASLGNIYHAGMPLVVEDEEIIHAGCMQIVQDQNPEEVGGVREVVAENANANAIPISWLDDFIDINAILMTKVLGFGHVCAAENKNFMRIKRI
ncbi:hypothetical protein MIMGU_mgv1a017649mg [Erythranthe guttata]|uniref:NAC domain-containing protein n=1 Tax=Erythranthe guttata TaxID=4155 RepID=A0A022RXK4_ERYGU|nr:hypothetical protein MIMGU_mgv1a017649mg [Erythranthe guttata]